MSEIQQITNLISSVFLQLLILLFYLRIMIRLINADFYIPLVQTVAKLSNPLCYPLSKLFRFNSKFDTTAFITIILIVFAYRAFVANIVFGYEFKIAGFLLSSLVFVIDKFLNISFWLVIISAIASWLGRVDNHNAAIVLAIGYYINNPVRRLLPSFGGIDISPIFTLLFIQIIEIVILQPIAIYAISI